MESINRLRRYVECHDKITGLTATCINHFIDSIDKEVDDMWHALTIDAKPMTDENMAADGWVRLPVDADGVPIHVGEMVDEKLPLGGYAAPAPIDTMELSRGASGYCWMVKLDAENRSLINPKLLRHHHEPTVEDVLREFVDAWAEWKDGAAMMNPVETFAAKLRLAGEDE